MTQFGIAVASLNRRSVFRGAYEKGIRKQDYWTYTLDDCLSLIGRLPALAARIYRNTYHPEKALPSIDRGLDLVGKPVTGCAIIPIAHSPPGNYSRLLGYGDNKDMTDYLRLYISIHGDHEGGNASAHTARNLLQLPHVRSASQFFDRPCWIHVIGSMSFLLRVLVCPCRAVAWVS
jgi:citrate synthase